VRCKQSCRREGLEATVVTKNQVPRPRSLRWWEDFFEGEIKASTLRAEVRAGRLKCYRARGSCTGKILLAPEDVADWLRNHAAGRQRVLSPSQTSKAMKAARA
jgi:hypothetical protein